MKRLAALLASLALLPFLGLSQAQVGYFSDVSEGTNYYQSIEFLYELGIVDGNPDGSYAPDNTLNRAEFAKLMVVIEGEYEPAEPTESCFEDVPLGEWYSKYICRAKELGIVTGDNGEGIIYRPTDTLNKAEILAAMSRSFYWDTELPVADEQWFDPLFTTSASMNILTGDRNGQELVTRGVFADMLAKNVVVYDLGESSFGDYSAYENYWLTDWTWTAEDCFADEFFNEETQTCELKCDDDNCGLIAVAQEEKLDALSEAIWENPTHTHDGSAGDDFISKYPIVEGELGDDAVHNMAPEHLSAIDTKEYHNKIWTTFTSLVPSHQIRDIREFHIYTDGPDGVLGEVRQHPDNPKEWILRLDLEDTLDLNGEIKSAEVYHTIIHEFAHILTLREGQLRLDTDLYYGTGLPDPDTYYNNEVERCPTYFPGEGCSVASSYINKFFVTYWADIYGSHPTNTMDANASAGIEDATHEWYHERADQFVTDYAATNPAEDIAESFTAFVLKDKPNGDSIADQKLRFFWDFPELVKLRELMRVRLGK